MDAFGSCLRNGRRWRTNPVASWAALWRILSVVGAIARCSGRNPKFKLRHFADVAYDCAHRALGLGLRWKPAGSPAATGTIHVSGAGRKMRRPKRRGKPGAGAYRSSLTALVMALSFVFQLLAIPYHQALVAAAEAAPSPAEIAAELRATFGDATTLCTQSEDHGPGAPAGDREDHCPLCQFAAQAAVLIAPVAPALPIRLAVAFLTIGAAPETGAVPLPPTKQSRARAPPFAV